MNFAPTWYLPPGEIRPVLTILQQAQYEIHIRLGRRALDDPALAAIEDLIQDLVARDLALQLAQRQQDGPSLRKPLPASGEMLSNASRPPHM